MRLDYHDLAAHRQTSRHYDQSLYHCTCARGNNGLYPIHAVVSPADVDMLAGLLSKVAAHWDIFLGQLSLTQHKRDVIKNDNANKAKFSVWCLLEGLHRWVGSEDRPMYGRFTAALRGSTASDGDPVIAKVQGLLERLQNQDLVKCSQTNAEAQCHNNIHY